MHLVAEADRPQHAVTLKVPPLVTAHGSGRELRGRVRISWAGPVHQLGLIATDGSADIIPNHDTKGSRRAVPNTSTLTPSATVNFLEGLINSDKQRRVEKRSEQRYRANTLATYTVVDQAGEWSARVVNLSQSGLGLRLSEPLSAGLMISVNVGRIKALGEIRWCRPTSGGYKAGVKIMEVIEIPQSE